MQKQGYALINTDEQEEKLYCEFEAVNYISKKQLHILNWR